MSVIAAALVGIGFCFILLLLIHLIVTICDGDTGYQLWKNITKQKATIFLGFDDFVKYYTLNTEKYYLDEYTIRILGGRSAGQCIGFKTYKDWHKYKKWHKQENQRAEQRLEDIKMTEFLESVQEDITEAQKDFQNAIDFSEETLEKVNQNMISTHVSTDKDWEPFGKVLSSKDWETFGKVLFDANHKSDFWENYGE